MSIPKSFFQRDSIQVAKDLLGCFFVTKLDEGKVIGQIVETEAYHGTDDLACHASKGKTERNQVLFGEAGLLYIYLNYGIFHLTNIVCDKTGFPSAVLLRSAQILEGEDIAQKRLKENRFVKANSHLATGPGKLSIAFGLDKKHNQREATGNQPIYFLANPKTNFDIIESARVGVDYAGHCKDYPWRFYFKDNPFVSRRG